MLLRETAHIDLIHSIIAQFSNLLPQSSQISPHGQGRHNDSLSLKCAKLHILPRVRQSPCERTQASRVPSSHVRGAVSWLGISNLDCHGIMWPRKWRATPLRPITGKYNLKLDRLERGEVRHISPYFRAKSALRVENYAFLSKLCHSEWPQPLASASCHYIFPLPWVLEIVEAQATLFKQDILSEVIQIPYKAIYNKY